MTEAARKTIEEINKKRMDELNKKIDNSTLDSATDEVMDALGVLAGLIKNKVVSTDDKIVMIGGTALLEQFISFMEAVATYRDLCEASELMAEMEKNKNDQLS